MVGIALMLSTAAFVRALAPLAVVIESVRLDCFIKIRFYLSEVMRFIRKLRPCPRRR